MVMIRGGVRGVHVQTFLPVEVHAKLKEKAIIEHTSVTDLLAKIAAEYNYED